MNSLQCCEQPTVLVLSSIRLSRTFQKRSPNAACLLAALTLLNGTYACKYTLFRFSLIASALAAAAVPRHCFSPLVCPASLSCDAFVLQTRPVVADHCFFSSFLTRTAQWQLATDQPGATALSTLESGKNLRQNSALILADISIFPKGPPKAATVDWVWRTQEGRWCRGGRPPHCNFRVLGRVARIKTCIIK